MAATAAQHRKNTIPAQKPRDIDTAAEQSSRTQDIMDAAKAPIRYFSA